MKHILPVLLPAALLAACAETITTQGQVVLPSRLAQVKPGVSTQADVQQLLGSPSTTSTFKAHPQDGDTWYYITSIVKDKVLRPNQLQKRDIVIVTFTPSGTVAGLEKKTEADGKTVDPVAKTTPTQGQSMGVFQQMFGNLGLGNP